MPAAPVAGFNPFQTQSFNQILGMQGSLNNTAGANLQTAQAPITQDDINQNMNPYADQTEADIKKYIFDPQRVQTMGQSTAMAGGVGADRLGLVSGNLDKTQGDILAQARSGFYGQALSAAQQAKQQALQSAQGWQNLQTGNLQATNALGMVGTQQQQQTQAELMSPYQQILAQIAYPYQQAQFLAGITGGLAGAMGGTTTGVGNTSTTPAQPSLFNQITGLGVAGAGIAGAAGAFDGSGGSTSTPNSPNASMYTGPANEAGFGPTYYRSGGPVHYASGGSDDEAPSLSPYGDINPIPRIPLHMTSGQSHNNLNLNPPSQGGGSSSSGGIGDIAKMASAVIPFLLKRGGTVAGGGAVSPYDAGMGFAGGGETEGLSPIPYIPMQDTSGQSHNNLNLNPPTSSGGSSSSGMGDMAKIASAVLPLLMMKRGGKAPHGYATDGGVDVEEYSPDDFNPIDAAAPAEPDYSRPIEREAPNLGMWPFNRGQADYKGDVTMFPHTAAPATAGAAQATPSPANAPVGDQAEILRQAGLLRDPLRREEAANAPGPFDTSALKGPYNQAALGSPARGPVSTDTTPRTAPPPAPSQPDVQVASGADRTGGYPNRSRLAGLNSDMKLSDFSMPRSAQPYPDALSRDFGQRATRSPWMALVQAGLKMAQSTKPGVAGLAEGAESGVAYLDKQRGELRSEQQINQKAEELFRHAQGELNKYTRTTPHEARMEAYQSRLLDQGKYQFLNYTDPVTNEVKVGRANTKTGVITDPATGEPVKTGRLLGRASSQGGLPPSSIVSIQNAVNNDPTIPRDKKIAEVNRRVQEATSFVEAQRQRGVAPPPDGALEFLKNNKDNPAIRAQFEAKYPGWAAKLLGE
jgi:hypothetical protein